MYALRLARRISKRYGVRLQKLSKRTISVSTKANKRGNKASNQQQSIVAYHRRQHRHKFSTSIILNKYRLNISSTKPSVYKPLPTLYQYTRHLATSNSGLAGVIVCDSKISTVGETGAGLTYHGYSVNELAINCQFEEIAYLLTRGKLPNRAQLHSYIGKLNEYNASIPADLIKILQLLPKHSHPMDVLKVTCSALGTQYNERNIFSTDETMEICDRLLAIFPTAMCFHHRFHFYNEHVQTLDIGNSNAANSEECIAERIVRLLNGNDTSVQGYEFMVEAMNRSLICYAEHGLAASTFCARVTASTLSDTYSAICSGISTLKGSLHGGANEAALELIGSFDGDMVKADDGVRRMIAEKQVIMGFGHRIYKKGDPRSPIMKETAMMLQSRSKYADMDMMNVAQVIENVMCSEKKIYPNMDFYAAMVYYQCGIPKDLYTPIFVCARTAGWTAHVMEQRKDNKLIRPSSKYVGPELKPFVRIDDRE